MAYWDECLKRAIKSEAEKSNVDPVDLELIVKIPGSKGRQFYKPAGTMECIISDSLYHDGFKALQKQIKQTQEVMKSPCFGVQFGMNFELMAAMEKFETELNIALDKCK